MKHGRQGKPNVKFPESVKTYYLACNVHWDKIDVSSFVSSKEVTSITTQIQDTTNMKLASDSTCRIACNDHIEVKDTHQHLLGAAS